ncbi:MAG: CDP-alcohol phosphatidyltransferase family protein [bacterium]|nr:CDP-alcohol phosphatidyltransferase family protein [bacterium]
MSIYALKPRFQQVLSPARRRLIRRGVSANQITGAGLAASALVGVTFVAAIDRPALLWAIPVLLLTRMALNALDGQVARETGTATAGGRMFNEMADVIGDVVAYLPVAFLLPSHTMWVAAVVCGGLLAEFASVIGGEPRRNQGPLGKSDRAFAFGALAVVLALGAEATGWITGLLAMLAVATALTVLNRVRHV